MMHMGLELWVKLVQVPAKLLEYKTQAYMRRDIIRFYFNRPAEACYCSFNMA